MAPSQLAVLAVHAIVASYDEAAPTEPPTDRAAASAASCEPLPSGAEKAIRSAAWSVHDFMTKLPSPITAKFHPKNKSKKSHSQH